MKKLLVLAAALVLASCELIPEIEGPYPADSTARLGKNREQVFNTPGGDRENQPPEESQDTSASQPADESGAETRTDEAAQTTAEAEPDSVPTPLVAEEQARETELDEPDALELAEAYYPEQAPDGETPVIPVDEPLVQLPPPAVQPVPPVEQTPVQPPAASPTIVRPDPPQRETPPERTETPVPPAVTVLPPTVTPAVPPVTEETPEEEVPPEPEREPYTPVIPNMPFQPETAAPALAESALPYSRTVRAVVGQYIEIPFRGPGWVYLGEFGSRRGVRYDSRRMDPDGMTFVFRADAEGTYSLKFNRHDFVRDYILNDHVRVIVEEPPIVTGSSWSNSQVGPDRVYASPRWPLATDPEGRAVQPSSAQPPNTAREQNAAQGEPSPASQNPAPQTAAAANAVESGNAPATNSTSPGVGAPGTSAASIAAPASASASNIPAGNMPATDPAQVSAANAQAVPQTEDWLKKAQEEYNAGRIPGALSALDQFMIRFPGGSDEAYWLYGQALEANNEATRDIRLALDYYRRLTGEFPQSSRYDEARRRIVYLERFYFNIQ